MTQVHPEHSPNLQGAQGFVYAPEASKLLPWLMLIALLAGISLGVSLLLLITTPSQLDRQYRFLQELRVRVEDAEMAAKEVNPSFKPARQPKGP